MRFCDIFNFFMTAGLCLCVNQGFLNFAGKICNYVVYLLADYVPVGEAITLAMRTAVPWFEGR